MSDDLVTWLRQTEDELYGATRCRKAADRIEQLEAALREIAYARPECCCISNAMQGIARAALEGKKDER